GQFILRTMEYRGRTIRLRNGKFPITHFCEVPMKRSLPCLLLPAALLLALPALADEVSKKDGILVNAAGHTVYTFDKDTAGSGQSACNGPCAENWPPVTPPASVAAPYSVITRADGGKQLAYQGKPLYLFK